MAKEEEFVGEGGLWDRYEWSLLCSQKRRERTFSRGNDQPTPRVRTFSRGNDQPVNRASTFTGGCNGQQFCDSRNELLSEYKSLKLHSYGNCIYLFTEKKAALPTR